jgi:hypothetical protein
MKPDKNNHGVLTIIYMHCSNSNDIKLLKVIRQHIQTTGLDNEGIHLSCIYINKTYIPSPYWPSDHLAAAGVIHSFCFPLRRENKYLNKK